jgi:D-ribose pyranose/furanose isomerase RbsD
MNDTEEVKIVAEEPVVEKVDNVEELKKTVDSLKADVQELIKVLAEVHSLVKKAETQVEAVIPTGWSCTSMKK